MGHRGGRRFHWGLFGRPTGRRSIARRQWCVPIGKIDFYFAVAGVAVSSSRSPAAARAVAVAWNEDRIVSSTFLGVGSFCCRRFALFSGIAAFVDSFEGIGIEGNDCGVGRRLCRNVVVAVAVGLVAVWGVWGVCCGDVAAICILEGGVGVVNIVSMVAQRTRRVTISIARDVGHKLFAW